MSVLARRYATAAAQSLSQKPDAAALDGLAAQLRLFGQMGERSEALQEVLRNPVLGPKRQAVLEPIYKRLGIEGVGARLLSVLARNSRTGLIFEVASELEAMADQRAGRRRAKVLCASQPTEAQRKALVQTLEQRLGGKVILQVTVQPELLGGLVCQVGDTTFDTSLKRQLDILTERLGAQA